MIYLDVIKKSPLTPITVQVLRPLALLVTGAVEGRVAAEEDVDHHPETPEVTLLVVHQILIAVLNVDLHHLRRHELWGPHRAAQDRRGVRPAPGGELDGGAQPEVTELHRDQVVLVHA